MNMIKEFNVLLNFKYFSAHKRIQRDISVPKFSYRSRINKMGSQSNIRVVLGTLVIERELSKYTIVEYMYFQQLRT